MTCITVAEVVGLYVGVGYFVDRFLSEVCLPDFLAECTEKQVINLRWWFQLGWPVVVSVGLLHCAFDVVVWVVGRLARGT